MITCVGGFHWTMYCSCYNVGTKKDVTFTMLAKQSSLAFFCESEFDSLISLTEPSSSESFVTFINARSAYRCLFGGLLRLKLQLTYTTLNLQILWEQHHIFNKKQTIARIVTWFKTFLLFARCWQLGNKSWIPCTRQQSLQPRPKDNLNQNNLEYYWNYIGYCDHWQVGPTIVHDKAMALWRT